MVRTNIAQPKATETVESLHKVWPFGIFVYICIQQKLSFNVGGLAAPTSIRVYSIKGELLITQRAGQQDCKLDIARLPKGAYLLQADSKMGKRQMKIIK